MHEVQSSSHGAFSVEAVKARNESEVRLCWKEEAHGDRRAWRPSISPRLCLGLVRFPSLFSTRSPMRDLMFLERPATRTSSRYQAGSAAQALARGNLGAIAAISLIFLCGAANRLWSVRRAGAEAGERAAGMPEHKPGRRARRHGGCRVGGSQMGAFPGSDVGNSVHWLERGQARLMRYVSRARLTGRFACCAAVKLPGRPGIANQPQGLGLLAGAHKHHCHISSCGSRCLTSLGPEFFHHHISGPAPL